MRSPLLTSVLVLSTWLATEARGDVVVLKDGTSLEGRIVSRDGDELVIDTTFDGTKRVPKAEVASVDTSSPPLRDQLKYRANEAKDDVARLWDLHRWAREKGFTKELVWILQRLVEISPEDKRARKMLGHEKVDGRWMTPEEKVDWQEERHAEEMRAKGLVPHEGRWVTPAEKEALEKGLLRDGEDWVTEEEWHRRRGEQRVGDAWVKVGEAEGKAWADGAAAAIGVTLERAWSPHFDVVHDGMPENAARTLEGAEKMFARTRTVLRPTAEDLPETVAARIRVVLFKKQPAYAKFAKWFDETAKASELVTGWGRAVAKQHAFWWADPDVAVAYQFPNTDKTLVSNALHNVGLILLTRYRFNFKFPSPWLMEGFAYWLELETIGYSESFTLGRGGAPTIAPGATEGTAPLWSDSAKWKQALGTLVTEGRDPPLKRLSGMTGDQMGYEELVKSWSVVDWLVRKDAVKFKAFLDGVKDRSLDEETALRAAFGGGYREIDQAWKAFVTGGFQTP